jgi:hypothetical protein
MSAAPANPLATLEVVLRQLLAEHRALLVAADAHEAALRSCLIDRIEKTAREQDIARQKIATTETRRRQLTHQLSRQHKLLTPPTLTKLGELYPARAAALKAIRADLAEVAGKIREKSSLTTRIAQSVLGHVNATLRLVAHAAAGPSPYTRRGDASLPSGRMGVLNAVA